MKKSFNVDVCWGIVMLTSAEEDFSCWRQMKKMFMLTSRKYSSTAVNIKQSIQQTLT
jgi:hypothetical protein